MRKFAVILVFWSCLAFAADPPQDAVSVLAQILAQKGTISTDELNRVEAASSQDRVSVLATILRAKGLLDSEDLARLSVPPTEHGRAIVTSSNFRDPPRNRLPRRPQWLLRRPMPLPFRSRPEPADTAEVNTGKHVPITIYGTLLFNAGFDGAAFNLNDTGSVVEKPGSSTTATNQSFFETPRQTRLGIRLDPTEVAGAQLIGRFRNGRL